MIPSELRTAGWYISQSGSAHEGPFGEEMIRLRLANGTLSSDCLIWRHGMRNWAKLQSVPELHTAPLPTNTNAGPTPIESMDWANLSLMTGWALLVVSVLGGYWGYSWFTGVGLFFLAYLIGQGFTQVMEKLSRIETQLSSKARGSNQND